MYNRDLTRGNVIVILMQFWETSAHFILCANSKATYVKKRWYQFFLWIFLTMRDEKVEKKLYHKSEISGTE